MSKRSDKDLLQDILEAVRRILSYTRKMNYEIFTADKKTQDAVVRNFEIIGEASKNISPTFKNRHPKIPWSELARFRDRLIHHYSGVNYDIVWGILQNSLPKLEPQIRGVLSHGFFTPRR